MTDKPTQDSAGASAPTAKVAAKSAKSPTPAAKQASKNPAAKQASKSPAAKAEKQAAFVRVYRTGSAIGRPRDQGETLIGLGLKKTHATRILEKTPSVMGMIRKVRHLVRYEDVGEKS